MGRGYHWGEWLEPGVVAARARTKDHGSVGTAFLHHSARLWRRIGRMLGHDAEASALRGAGGQCARRVADGVRRCPTARLTPDTQANHVRALAFGLVPEGLRAQAAGRLVELVRAAGTHLGTGFLATPVPAARCWPTPAPRRRLRAAAPGHSAVVAVHGRAWGHHDLGALGGDRRRRRAAHESLNHYSKGAVVSFLHRYVAGIELLDEHPAYRHSGSSPARAADSPGPKRCTTRRTGVSSPPGMPREGASG